jgi:hypothetical protein
LEDAGRNSKLGWVCVDESVSSGMERIEAVITYVSTLERPTTDDHLLSSFLVSGRASVSHGISATNVPSERVKHQPQMFE